jgi:RHS repeat-associated protein
MLPNPFQFVGEHGVTKEGVGFGFMRTRYYTPRTGRFTSPDPINLAGGDLNLYRYAANAPVSLVDPDGLTCGYKFSWAGPDDRPGWGPHRYVVDDKGVKYNFGTYSWPEFILSLYWGINVPGKHTRTEKINGKAVTTEIPGPGFFNAWFFNCWTQSEFDYLTYCPQSKDPVAQPPPPTLPGPTTTNITVWASDPNRMTGPAGFGSLGFIPNETLLSYRIDFENETNATAPAQEVVITDPLTTNLNWATFQLTELGWGDQLIILPPNTQHFETNMPVSVNGTSFEVQIEAGIHLNSGQAYAVFRSIDPATGLPPSVDAGFLPPEDGTGRGQGHVSYIIRSKPNLPTGTEIRNVALISFDHQPAIATNQRDPHDPSQGTDPAKEALNTIDADPPSGSVAGLPATQTTCDFAVCWSGTDVGAGVTSYDVHVSTNGGPWTLWLAGSTNTCAIFSGQGGNSYAFYSIARDGTGNTEAPPLTADATTTVDTDCVTDVRLTIDHSALPGGEGERITITYPILPGRSYTVESRDTLGEGGSWQPLPGAPHNTGSVVETNILSQRFYRVRITE